MESAWRNKDWSDKESRDSIEEQLQQMSDVATPRRRVYEAFLALVKTPVAMDRNADFTRILEDAMQLALRKWVGLPGKDVSGTHSFTSKLPTTRRTAGGDTGFQLVGDNHYAKSGEKVLGLEDGSSSLAGKITQSSRRHQRLE